MPQVIAVGHSAYSISAVAKEKIIVIGLIANTCIEATARIGMELGYHVTLVCDATAVRSREALHAAMDIDGPTYAHEILTSPEVIAAMRNSSEMGIPVK